MSDQRIKIPRTSDRAIADVYKQLGEQYGVAKANVSALGFTSLGNVSLTDDLNDTWVFLLELDSYLINDLSFQIRGLNISYYRGGNYSPQEKSPIYDEILLGWNKPQQQQPELSNKDKLEIIAFLNKKLRSFESERIVGRCVSKEDSQLIAIHNSTLERLERLNEDLVRQTLDLREKLEERIQESLRKNDENFLKQKEILEEELNERKKGLETKYSTKLQRLENEKKELDFKLKAIDDRDNTHVRREIRDSMLNDVRRRIDTFGVSPATARKRLPVLVTIFGLVFLFLGLMQITWLEINSLQNPETFPKTLLAIAIMNQKGVKPEASSKEPSLEMEKTDSKAIAKAVSQSGDEKPDATKKNHSQVVDNTYLYLLWLRFTLYSFGCFGTLLYYIKWQNKWAEQHASSEFQLQQFYLDINRSNWVIESCLEWQKETQSSIPKELLASITNNLFSNSEAEFERVIHPADELASALMGSASKLKLKIGDSELDFNNPQKIGNKPLISKASETED